MIWPRSLHKRILLVMAVALAIAHLCTFALVYYERGSTMRGMMVSYLASDVASSVAMLERLPAAERTEWLPRLARQNYRLHLNASGTTPAARTALARTVEQELQAALARPVQMADPHMDGIALRAQMQLADGTALAVDMDEPRMLVSEWAWAALALQLALLTALCAWAVRTATQPLRHFANAADTLGRDGKGPPLPEDGPSEVARAATAFNHMQQRIQEHLDERMRILAAVSHDLQTPITRLRLRAELLDDPALQDRLLADLAEMQALVEEGLTYARSSQARHEPMQPTDLRALLESIARDYTDAGRPVLLLPTPPLQQSTRPQALRRTVCNLVDNALKFAGHAELQLLPATTQGAPGFSIHVRDRGPGIPEHQLSTVRKPFVRLEDSRNRNTGGTGLGLAIATELVQALGGELTLTAREGGGLDAGVSVPCG